MSDLVHTPEYQFSGIACQFISFVAFPCSRDNSEAERSPSEGLELFKMALIMVNRDFNMQMIQDKLGRENFFRFPTRSDTNWPVQSQKMARSLTFQI